MLVIMIECSIIMISVSFVAGGQLPDASVGHGHVSGGWHGRQVQPFPYNPQEECTGENGKLVYCPKTDSLDKTFCCGEKSE